LKGCAHRPAVDHPPELHARRTGGGVAYNREEFIEIVRKGLTLTDQRSADRGVAARLEGI